MSVTMCDLDYLKMQCEIHEKQLLACQEELQKCYEETLSMFKKCSSSTFETLLTYYIRNELKAIGEITQKCVNAKSETIKEIERLLVEVDNREEFEEHENPLLIECELQNDWHSGVVERKHFTTKHAFACWILDKSTDVNIGDIDTYYNEEKNTYYVLITLATD